MALLFSNTVEGMTGIETLNPTPIDLRRFAFVQVRALFVGGGSPWFRPVSGEYGYAVRKHV